MGQAHQREEDRRRQRRGEVLVEVALAARHELVDDLVDERTRLGFELGHALRRELRVEQAPVLRVLGRVDRQRDQRDVVADLDDVLRREHLGVLERPEHVVVARQAWRSVRTSRSRARPGNGRASPGTRDAGRRRRPGRRRRGSASSAPVETASSVYINAPWVRGRSWCVAGLRVPGWRNSFDAFSHVTLRTTSAGTSRNPAAALGWVSGQVESACG